MRKGRQTTLEETSVEFVHGSVSFVQSIHQHAANAHFPTVKRMTDGVGGRCIASSQAMVHPAQPLACLQGLKGLRSFPTVEGLNCHGLGHEVPFSPIAITGRGDGDTFLKRIQLGLLTKFLDKFHAPCLQQFHVRHAIFLHLAFQIEDKSFSDACVVPRDKFATLLGRHAFRVVHGLRWHGSFVILIGDGVEQMGKKSLVQFGQSKRGQKRRPEKKARNRASL